MLTQVLKTLFGRDLEALKKEVASYHKEENLWVTDRGIANSAGNLCLHLVGNLNAFIGAEIGKTGYVRNRPLEFSQKDVPRSTLLEMLDDTLAVVNLSLDQLDEATGGKDE